MLKQTSFSIEFGDYSLAQEMSAARLSAAVKTLSKFVLRMEAGKIFDLWHIVRSEYIFPAFVDVLRRKSLKCLSGKYQSDRNTS